MRRWLLFFAILTAGGVGVVLGCVRPGMPLAAYVAAVTGLTLLPGLVDALRTAREAMAALVLGGALGPPLALGTWFVVNPIVHVDNATARPLQIWIDGERAMVVEPAPAIGEPPRLRVPYGTRRLAWSELTGAPALHSIEIEIEIGHQHLYSPGAAGCYWLEATAYGNASTHEIQHGPLRVEEFYRFDGIDVWLGDNPKRVSTESFRDGATSVALQRHRACMELSGLGCSADVRDEFIRCETSFAGLGERGDCFNEAAKQCKEGSITEGSSSAGGKGGTLAGSSSGSASNKK